MSVTTRWTEYSTTAVGSTYLGGNNGKGTRGYSIGTADISDSVTIGSTTNRLYLNIDGNSGYITLFSGTSLDPRFIARDITEKMYSKGDTEGWDGWKYAICSYENVYNVTEGNCFKIYSGSLGSSSSVVTATSGTNSAHSVLGFGSKSESGGYATSNTSTNNISVSGTCYNFLPEIYKVVITVDNSRGIGPSSPVSGSYGGTLTTAGVYTGADTTYTITIDTTNGTTMGQGTGNVPTMSWTAAASADDSTQDTELLYADHWYYVGTRGLMVKFSDSAFTVTTGDSWTIACTDPDYAQGSNVNAAIGTAQYAWSSDRGDKSTSVVTTVSGSYTQLGSRGLNIRFDAYGATENLSAGDTFYVICAAPQPSSYDISSISFGNVTVSSDSDVKCVIFEAISGAVEVSSVKFGLQSHGTFSHHNAGNSDTEFRFGTGGPANTFGGSPTTGKEWLDDVVASDINRDTPANDRLYATEDNLSVVATADASESVGSKGLVADPVWFNIYLGGSETGSNSGINYRTYFDYS